MSHGSILGMQCATGISNFHTAPFGHLPLEQPGAQAPTTRLAASLVDAQPAPSHPAESPGVFHGGDLGAEPVSRISAPYTRASRPPDEASKAGILSRNGRRSRSGSRGRSLPGSGVQSMRGP